MLPKQDHPLTLAYIAGARATTHQAIRDALAIARSLETDADEITRHQCKLAAEVLMERGRA